MEHNQSTQKINNNKKNRNGNDDASNELLEFNFFNSVVISWHIWKTTAILVISWHVWKTTAIPNTI